MSQEHVSVVRRWFEDVWNRRDERAIDELVTCDSVCFADDGPIRGPEEFRQRQYRPFLAAFPDLRIELDGIVSEGEQVVVRWTASGTHTGAGLGFDPTGEAVVFQGMSWVVVRDGKLAEGWQNSNIPAVVHALSAAASKRSDRGSA